MPTENLSDLGRQMREMNEHQRFKSMSNKEFLEYVCDYSKAGPMAQVIVVEALRTYLEAVLKEARPLSNPIAFVCPARWYDYCETLQKEFKSKYE